MLSITADVYAVQCEWQSRHEGCWYFTNLLCMWLPCSNLQQQCQS